MGKEDRDKLTVEGPHMSLWCTTVPTFYRQISKEHLGNGLVSRLLVFESDDPDPYVRWPPIEAQRPPAGLVDWCKRWLADRGEGGDLRIEPRTIPATREAMAEFDAVEAELRALRKELREKGEDQGPYTRGQAQAVKLALIRACGMGAKEVTAEDARWGCDLAWQLTRAFVARVEEVGASDNRIEDAKKKLLKMMRDRGEQGISKSALSRGSQFLEKRQRDELLRDLEEAGLATRLQTTTASGRTAETWCAK